jgi:hypothetical protein
VGYAGFDSRLVAGSGLARAVFDYLARVRRTGRSWNGRVRWNRRINVRGNSELFESLCFKGGLVDLNWRGHDGSLGVEAARRLPCPKLSKSPQLPEQAQSRRTERLGVRIHRGGFRGAVCLSRASIE